jgi:two-component system, OmpR family, phosphate regulon sensor histidine kinase PhoR
VVTVLLLLLLTITTVILAVMFGRSEQSRLRAEDELAQIRSELERRVTDLERQHASDRAILNGIGEGMLVIDRARHVVSSNRRFREMFGLAEAIDSKPLAEVVRIRAVFDGFDLALAGRESTERFSMADRKIEMRALPLASQDAAVALFIDVTLMERLEQLRRNFIADFSHEVRTPLAGLRSAVETFEGAKLNGEEELQLRRIMARQLARLERLVDDLAELSRIEAGDLTLNRRHVDLRRIVDEVCEEFADAAAHHGVQFVIEGARATVYVDPLRLQQALSNLIDNAIKYGGDDQEVRIEIVEQSDRGAVRITDRGEGIPESEHEKIFHRFYRVDKSRSQEIAGSGLGLAISKHLILQQRGTIRVESEMGKGSAFIVELPKGP